MALSHASALFEAIRAAGPTKADSLKRMDAVARLLDSAFLIPGTNQRIGIDAFIGLVPGIGDAVTTALSSYVIWEAKQLGIPKWVLGRMLVNLAIHGAVGIVPVFGDIFIAFFRVNRRNMTLVRRHLERTGASGVIEGRATRIGETR